MYSVFKRPSDSVNKILNKGSLSSSSGGSGISLSTFVVVGCLVFCFLQRFFSALSLSNWVAVVVVFGRLKFFCTGGGADWNHLNIGGDTLNVGGFSSWKGGGRDGWKGDGGDGGGKLLLLLLLQLKNVGLFLLCWAYFVFQCQPYLELSSSESLLHLF